MAYNKKIWVNRESEYPNRRKIKNTSTGTSEIVDVTREEGRVAVEGDSVNANTMNDLEQRITNAFDGLSLKVVNSLPPNPDSTVLYIVL